MHKYKITITVYGDNPNYEAEVLDFEEKYKNSPGRYRNNLDENIVPPLRAKNERVLEVFLTEEEFKAIKKSVLEVM